MGKILDFMGISENLCVVCNQNFKPEEQGFVCDECLKSVKPANFEDKEDIPYVDSYDYFGRYEGVLRECILLYKFKSVKPFSRFFANLIKNEIKRYKEEINADILTFVPVHFLRYWGRGYDHNEEVLKHTGMRFEKLLRRRKYAKPLAGYGKSEREKILKDAYTLKGDVKGKVILVYDDILTTGTTAKNVAFLLKEKGAKEVHFYFLAKE
ncbi:ComF family protein [Aquifex pyrophilus]